MVRRNKTMNNLKTVWHHLDEACGHIDHATYELAMMKDLPEDVVKDSERIDFSLIVSLKNKIEEMIEEKESSAKGVLEKNNK